MELDNYDNPDENSQTSKLARLKEDVLDFKTYFQKNERRFHDSIKFVFNTTLTEDDIIKLEKRKMPTLEFNIQEPILDRLRGEFLRQEPSVSVHQSSELPEEKVTPEFLKRCEFLEGHLKYRLKNMSSDAIYMEMIGGGYSVVFIYTDYLHNMSFNQDIFVEKAFDSTMTGFDPLARMPHKGDGRYCFIIYPLTKKDFINKFGYEKFKNIKFSPSLEGFEWSYKSEKQDIILLCQFFEKKEKKIKLVKLSTGQSIRKSHYNDLKEIWNKRGMVEQAPVIVEERETTIDTIVHYTFCESEILEEKVTDYKYLPLVFFDGNSAYMKDNERSHTYQMTKPMLHNAKGLQRGMNFAGQSLFSEIENIPQHKFKVSIEAIPEKYQEAYRNIQLTDVLLYNEFYNGDTNVRLSPPMEVQRQQIPPIIENIFFGANKIMQYILGNYDSVLGTNEKNVSGKTIENGAIHTSFSSTPYTNGFIVGLNQVAKVIIDLIPKYIVNSRNLPFISKDGKVENRVVNGEDDDNIMLNYNPDDFYIEVEASVNSEIQKQVAFDQLSRLMADNPILSELVTVELVGELFDNLNVRHAQEMKLKAIEFMKGFKEKREAAANAPNPQKQLEEGLLEVEAAKVKQRHVESQGKLSIEAAKLALDKEKTNAQIAQILSDIRNKEAKLLLEKEKVDSENARTAIEGVIELSKNAGSVMEESLI